MTFDRSTAVLVAAWVLSGAGIIAPASPMAASASTPASAKTVAAAPEKAICKSQPIAGSRLPGNAICMTRERWDEQSRDAHGSVSDAARHDQLPVDPMMGMMGRH